MAREPLGSAGSQRFEAATGGGADWRRTHTCGELRPAHVGQEVVLNGWVAARRDHGGIYFLDLRDRYGLTQVVLDERRTGALKVGPEFVLSVKGKVLAREAANVNAERPTGGIEVEVSSVQVLSTSPTPPFEIKDELDTALELRLRYRYLDLRRGTLQRNLVHRSRFINAMRRAFEDQGFVEVETPILTKATPEGARDYLVPSRVHPGEFYALPQSPQIFKQLLMVSGLDRYFQVARCFRDEDLRADRQPEFTQLDMEMSFVEEENIFAVWERALARVWKEVMGEELSTPFPRLSYDESMERFGCDKPDVRFGLELKDCAAWARASDFGVFQSALAQGGRVLGIAVPGEKLSRKDIEAFEQQAKGLGALGLAWWKASAQGGSGPLARFTSGDKAAALMQALSAKEGELCLFMAGEVNLCRKVLCDLRLTIARRLGLNQGGWRFLWVTRFPMFLWNAQDQHWESAHHPFTAPVDWEMGGASDGQSAVLGSLASRAYDLVLNGWELGSGSIRIHRADVQNKLFELLGIGPAERQEKFGFLLEALAQGAPPHGGFALGLDRIVALSLGLDNIREVLAFPKTASATDLMSAAPSRVAEEQLREVHIQRAGKGLGA